MDNPKTEWQKALLLSQRLCGVVEANPAEWDHAEIRRVAGDIQRYLYGYGYYPRPPKCPSCELMFREIGALSSAVAEIKQIVDSVSKSDE